MKKVVLRRWRNYLRRKGLYSSWDVRYIAQAHIKREKKEGTKSRREVVILAPYNTPSGFRFFWLNTPCGWD